MGDTYKDIQVVKEYIAMTYEKIQNKIAYLYMKLESKKFALLRSQ